MKHKKKETKVQKIITNYGMMLAGALIFALACNCFIVPSSLNNSGVIGFSQIVREALDRFTFIHLPISTVGILNFLFNIPLLMLAWFKISKKFCINTLLCVGAQTIFLTIVPILEKPILDVILANAVIGGIIAGVGSGFMLRGGSCSGGIDILGMYLSIKMPDFSIGKLAVVFNACVYAACAGLYDLEIAIYSIIYSYFMSQMVDKIHYQNIKMSATIFTRVDHVDKVITYSLRRGVTYWKGSGSYTDEDTYVIMTVVSKQEVNRLKQIVHDCDPKAFVIFNEGMNIDGNFEKRLA